MTLFQWIASLFQQVKLWAVPKPWEKVIRVRAGKHAKEFGPGWRWRIPLVDDMIVTNTRLRLAAVPGQRLTTADGRTISIALNVWFSIEHPLRAAMALQQPEDSCAGLAQTFAASYVLPRQLDEIDPLELQAHIAGEIERITEGLSIESVSVVEFVIVDRTYCLLNNEWRPQTRPDVHDKEG